MGEVFNLLSYNVKGLNNKSKRLQIFDFCKDKIKNNGIVLLQETHSSSKEMGKWKNEWVGDVFQNHGSSNSRGVMIAFSRGFDKKNPKYVDDNNGRIQILTFEHKHKKYMIINLYNDNIEKDQVETLKRVDNLMGTFSDINEYSIIIGGDWNFILDKDLDSYGGNPKIKLNSLAEHIKLKNKYMLCDIYRIRNQGVKRFTYRQRTPCLRRRLDCILISNTLQSNVISCDILSSLLSDHSPIYVVIKTCDGDFKKGKSYWKFNKALLEDPIYCEGMRRVINEKKVEYAAMDYQVRWELVKYEIRKFTMDY